VELDPVKGQVTDPLSLVSYLYCKDNPLRWVDPLGLESYILYDPYMFKFDVIQYWRSAVELAYGYKEYGDDVHLIQIRSENDFTAAWNKMDDEDGIDTVVLLFHSGPKSFEIREKRGSTAVVGTIGLDDISHLDKKNIDVVIEGQCNAGHLNYTDNVAQRLSEIPGVNKVVASDGTVWNWSTGAIQSIGNAVYRDEDGKPDTAWKSWMDAAKAGWSSSRNEETNRKFAQDEYVFDNLCHIILKHQLICIGDTDYENPETPQAAREHVSGYAPHQGVNYPIMTNNIGWTVYQGGYRVQLPEFQVANRDEKPLGNQKLYHIDQLTRAAKQFNIYKYLESKEFDIELGKEYEVQGNGAKVTPVVQDQRILVPIRFVAEQMGIDVKWDQDDQNAAVFRKNSTIIRLYPDLKEIYINGHKALHGKELNIAPTIIDNSMYVGIRDIAELFGAEIEWNQEDQKAVIQYLIPRQEDSE